MHKLIVPVMDLNKIVLRAIEPTDSSRMMDFENKIISENIMISRKDLRTLEECTWNAKHMCQDMEKGRGAVLIAEYQDKIVGYSAVFFLRQKSEHIGDFGIMLDKNFRNQGLGTKLSHALIQAAKEKMDGLELIQLGVFAENKPAISLYKKLGFKEVARIPKKYKYNNRYDDEVIMHLWLK